MPLLADGVRGQDIDRIFVFWSPEACIADSMTDDGLSKVVSGNTQVSRRRFYRAVTIGPHPCLNPSPQIRLQNAGPEFQFQQISMLTYLRTYMALM